MKNKKLYLGIKFWINLSFTIAFLFTISVTTGFILYRIKKNSVIYRNNLLNKVAHQNELQEFCKNFISYPEEFDLNDIENELTNIFTSDIYIHHIVIYNNKFSDNYAFKNIEPKNIERNNLFEFLSGNKNIKVPFFEAKKIIDLAYKNTIYEKISGLVIKVIPLKNHSDLLGYAQIGFTTKFFNRIVYTSIFWVLLLSITLLIITQIILRKIIGIYLNPVQKLIKFSKEITKENTNLKPLNISVNNEIGVLIDAFNRMIKNINDRIKDLQTIQILSMEITNELKHKELMNNIIKIFSANTNCKKCALLLYNEELNNLELKSGLNLKLNKFSINFGEGVCGGAALTCNYKFVDDITQYPDYLMFYKPEEIDLISNKAMLALPLFVKDKVTGIICLTDIDDSKNSGFSKSNIILYQTLASSAAISIENSNLYELAITDGLTKVYLHRYFQIKLQEEIDFHSKFNQPLCLLMLDIDHFKNFNDTYGHQQGDIVLRHLAEILKKSTRVMDIHNADRRSDIVARYGGEEFAIILPITDIEGAVTVAERIRTNVFEYEFPGQDIPLRVTVSIGISIFKQDMERNDLIKTADLALYKSKNDGRNRSTIYTKKLKEMFKENEKWVH